MGFLGIPSIFTLESKKKVTGACFPSMGNPGNVGGYWYYAQKAVFHAIESDTMFFESYLGLYRERNS
jgi:hypothetical protein